MKCVSLALLNLLVVCTATSRSDEASRLAASAGPGGPVAGEGRRHVVFYPVWSSWKAARAACAASGGDLLSLHSTEELNLARQLADTRVPVWLGGFLKPKSDSWRWSDNSSLSWMEQNLPQTPGGRGCLEMTARDGALHGAPCGELRFYFCSSATDLLDRRNPPPAGLPAAVSVYEVLWGSGARLAQEVLRSSTVSKQLRSGWLSESCYTSLRQQEALYLQHLTRTLEVLIGGLRGSDEVSQLLRDTLRAYSSRTDQSSDWLVNGSAAATPPPRWLRLSLRSFHWVVRDEPVYWLVALSARACLQNFLAIRLLIHRPSPKFHPEVEDFYQRWGLDSMEEVMWTQRFRNVIEEFHDQLDVRKAVNIFREHMVNQWNLHMAVICDDDGGDWWL